ncbi:hypothetical protein V6Z11_D02G265700 [Gossypium hirsutum]
MISARKLIKLARKWQKMAAIKRKRITFSTTASMVEKGHFVVYSADEKRFMLPLEYLKNEMVMELFTLAEEEFGIPSNGHLIFPFDSTFMEYTIGLIKRKASKEVEKALIMSIVNDRCSSSSLNLYQQETREQLPIRRDCLSPCDYIYIPFPLPHIQHNNSIQKFSVSIPKSSLFFLSSQSLSY